MIAKFDALKQRAAQRVAAARERSAAIDHVARAKQRYNDQRGDRQAGAVTYFGFLSFFPLIALAFAVVGYVVVLYPEARGDIERGISSALPGLVGDGPGQINVQQIANAKAGAGIIGLLGLLWAGTGWVDALREALRSMWLQVATGGHNFAMKKAYDVLVLVVLGLSLVASVAISGIATSATSLVLGFVDLADSMAARWLLRALAVLIAVASDAALFAVLFWRLSGVLIPRRRLLNGALLGAVGFEILKLFATYLVGNTTRNPVYATIAVAVGLLVWVNLVTRVTLFAAAWTATEAYDEPDTPAVPQSPAVTHAGRATRA